MSMTAGLEEGRHASGWDGFPGPLFIVGLPRSGTKLIRDLLNGSPAIGIPVKESHFIPYFVAKYGREPAAADPGWRRRFMADLRRTPFAFNFARAGRPLPADLLPDPAIASDWAAIFQSILTSYAPPDRRPGFIWGDKTPGYLRSLPLLREIYPRARVLHIIRDPREQCLSVRTAWGKSLLRAAVAWRRELDRGRQAGVALGSDYCEVRYEELTRQPERTLRQVCSQLRLQFDPSMLRLTVSSESLGRARGHIGILVGNTQKFRTELKPEEIRRIEQVVYPTALDLGYLPISASGERIPGRMVLLILSYLDALAAWRFHARNKGLRQGTLYLVRSHRCSAVRETAQTAYRS